MTVSTAGLVATEDVCSPIVGQPDISDGRAVTIDWADGFPAPRTGIYCVCRVPAVSQLGLWARRLIIAPVMRGRRVPCRQALKPSSKIASISTLACVGCARSSGERPTGSIASPATSASSAGGANHAGAAVGISRTAIAWPRVQVQYSAVLHAHPAARSRASMSTRARASLGKRDFSEVVMKET